MITLLHHSPHGVLHSALITASCQDLDNRANEEPGSTEQAAGVSPKRLRLAATGTTTATDLEAEIAAKQAQLAALLRDQSQAGSSSAPGKLK